MGDRTSDDRGRLRRVDSPDHRYARLARQWMQRWTGDAGAAGDTPPRGLIAMVERMMEHGRRWRVRRRFAWRFAVPVLVPGLAALAVVWLSRSDAPGPVSVRAPVTAPSVAATPVTPAPTTAPAPAPDQGPMFVARPAGAVQLRPGQTLTAPVSGELRVADARGTELTLEPGSTIEPTVLGAVDRFALRAGALRVRVAPLLAGQRFVVATADAEVEVHGTRFRVLSVPRPTACARALTRVSVDEGVVSVRSAGQETRLMAGEVWPPACALEIASAAAPRVIARTSKTSASSARVRAPKPGETIGGTTGTTTGTPAVAAAQTSLQRQNDLFHAAVRAKREGHADVAALLFDRFVHAYPQSSLVESALAQEMRLIATPDPGAAARLAGQYLARFPDGFARAEAQALVGRAGGRRR